MSAAGAASAIVGTSASLRAVAVRDGGEGGILNHPRQQHTSTLTYTSHKMVTCMRWGTVRSLSF